MEQVVIAPPEIIDAIDRGDLEAIEAWVAAGGDPNAKADYGPPDEYGRHVGVANGAWYDANVPRGGENKPYARFDSLLARAAWSHKTDIAEFLLAHGARVDATDATEGCRLASTPLCRAVSPYPPVSVLPTVRLMLSNGADPNLVGRAEENAGRTESWWVPPLAIAMYRRGDAPSGSRPSDVIPMVSMLLRAGADPAQKVREPRCARSVGRVCLAEDYARKGVFDLKYWVQYCDIDNVPPYYELYQEMARVMAEAADLLAAVRIAGSWPRYFLRPHMSCLVFRALCQRGRATFDHATPTVLVYLFGAPPSRSYALWREQKGPLRLLRHIDPHMPDLPDVVFWRVLTFMFGTAYDYPWVRPRLRARAAAAAAAPAAA